MDSSSRSCVCGLSSWLSVRSSTLLMLADIRTLSVDDHYPLLVDNADRVNLLNSGFHSISISLSDQKHLAHWNALYCKCDKKHLCHVTWCHYVNCDVVDVAAVRLRALTWRGRRRPLARCWSVRLICSLSPTTPSTSPPTCRSLITVFGVAKINEFCTFLAPKICLTRVPRILGSEL